MLSPLGYTIKEKLQDAVAAAGEKVYDAVNGEGVGSGIALKYIPAYDGKG